ncbi:MAG: carbon-nitrogen hydrolase [Gammaproteobacteria bacterium]
MKTILALVQHACSSSQQINLDHSIKGIRDASNQGAKLVLLQELHNYPYFCQQEDQSYFSLAESIPGPTTETLGKLAAELGIVIVTSLFERRGPGIYHNTAVVIEKDGSIAGGYRKMHIPDDPGYYEKYYFTPGDQGFTPVITSAGTLGVMVCWDQWFPEAARLMALSGAEILLYPTAIGWDLRDNQETRISQQKAWMTIQRSHAIANGIPVAACNRTGYEADPSNQSEGIQFWGSSFIANSFGEVLITAPEDQSAVILSSIDPKDSETTRQTWPFLRDRRIDAYDDLKKRFK